MEARRRVLEEALREAAHREQASGGRAGPVDAGVGAGGCAGGKKPGGRPERLRGVGGGRLDDACAGHLQVGAPEGGEDRLQDAGRRTGRVRGRLGDVEEEVGLGVAVAGAAGVRELLELELPSRADRDRIGGLDRVGAGRGPLAVRQRARGGHDDVGVGIEDLEARRQRRRVDRRLSGDGVAGREQVVLGAAGAERELLERTGGGVLGTGRSGRDEHERRRQEDDPDEQAVKKTIGTHGFPSKSLLHASNRAMW